MASDELRFKVTADGADAAAKEVAKVQDAVDRLEGTAAQVSVEAEDQATDVLEEAQGAVDDLDGADATVAVEADDEATDTLEAAQGAVDDLDGAGATVTAEADDEATDVLEDVASAVGDVDGQSAEVDIEANDNASGAIDDVTGSLGDLQGMLGSLPGPLGEIAGLLSNLGGGGAAGIAGLAAGLGAMAMEGVSQFQDLGIEVDNFATKTGASVDAASRLVEVAKDLDIGVANMETSIGRMNKVAGETPEAFDEIGASLVRTKDGNIDSVETFISVLDTLNKMPDASDRAKAGNEIFGRGWQNMSELVGMSADDLRARLEGVSASKLWDEGKIGQAQGLRDAFDSIADASDDVFLSIGQALAPAIAKLAPAFAEAIDSMAPLIDGLTSGFVPAIEAINPLLDEFSTKMELLSKVKIDLPSGGEINVFTGALGYAGGALDILNNKFGDTAELSGSVAPVVAETAGAIGALGDATTGAADATAWAEAGAKKYEDQLKNQADALQANIDKQNELSGAMDGFAESTIQLQEKSTAFTDSLAKYNEVAANTESTQADIDKAQLATVKSADALAKEVVDITTQQDLMNGTVTSSTTKLDRQNQSLLSQAATANGPARDAILNYTFALNDIPPDKQTKIEALIEEGKLDEANALLADLSKNRDARVFADADNASLNQTNRDLDNAARNREAMIFVKTSGAGFMLGGTTSGGAKPIQGMAPVPAAAAATTTATTVDTATPAAVSRSLGVNPATGKFELPIEALLDNLPTAAEIARKIGRVRIPVDAYVRTNPRINGAVPT